MLKKLSKFWRYGNRIFMLSLILTNFFSTLLASSISDGLAFLAESQLSDGCWMDSIVSKFHATSFSIITLMSYDQKDSTYLKGLNWIKEQEVQCLGLSLISDDHP